MSKAYVYKAIKKALKSKCRYKVAALAFDKKGNLIAISNNSFRFEGRGGGFHAERKLMARYGERINEIFICRVNSSGYLLNIDPCEKCQKIANKLNIRITSIDSH